MRKQKNKKKGGSPGMSVLRSEKGVVLVMTLILSAISLAFMAALIAMATNRTQIASSLPRYVTACDAAKAGGNIVIQAINVRDVPAVSSVLTNFDTPDLTCFRAKLRGNTSDWALSCNASLDMSLDIDPTNIYTYDMSFDLGTTPVYGVYAKIADTIIGNSDKDQGFGMTNKYLVDIGVVHSHQQTIASPQSPYLYGVEVCAIAKAKTAEECCMSLLYQF